MKKLFNSCEEAIQFGLNSKDTPEEIGILCQKFIDLVNQDVANIQKNIKLYTEVCVEFLSHQ